jgi:predicted glutamine amidotransferase
MCGIVGFITNFKTGFSSTEMDAFYNMLYFDALRGLDSTGVFGVDNVGNVQVHKEATHALGFMQNKELHDFKRDSVQKGKIVVGHNRAATRGSITDENAHPFVVEDRIVLVQNGTWVGSHKHVKDTEVDTEALAHLIYEHADDIPEAFKKINAAYALCWYDVTTKRLHLARNKERPLFIAKLKNGGVAWCSEAGFMRLAMIRNQIEIESVDLIPEHTLITFAIDDRAVVRLDDVALPSFRHIIQQTTQSWPYTGEEIGAPFRPKLTVPSVSNPRRPNHVAPDDWIEFDFYTVVTEKLPEKIIHQTEAADLLPRLSELRMSKQPIELLDYAKANNSPTCKTWHVYGGLVLPDENDTLSNIVIHWFLYGKTEMEVMEYVAHAFYVVSLNSMRAHTVNGHQKIVTSIATEITPVPALNHNALIQ